MKDAYSFDATLDGLDERYRQMHAAYCRIFQRCGLDYVIVQAQSGEIGGSGSEEFMVPCSAGEDVIVHTAEDYAANIEKAAVDPLAAPDDLDAQRQAVSPMEYVDTPGVGSIEAVCDFLKTRPDQMIKTLIYRRDEKTVIALVRGDHDANEAKIAALVAGDEPLELADPSVIQELTGAEVGFAGPQGLVDKVDALLVDHAVAVMVEGTTGANRTDAHVRHVVPGRDFPLAGESVTVADLRNATEGDNHDGQPLQFSRGIEVGHIFKLGTKYSKALEAWFLDENGQQQPCIMGCYGIGVNRILASAIESGHDANGLVLPISIAPFEVEVIPLNNDKDQVRDLADKVYNALRSAGIDVLLDDRDERAGVKFKDADLIGIPLRIVIGERGLKDGNVEIKRRTEEKPTVLPADTVIDQVRAIVDELRTNLNPKT
jgi:prolyl-tRNA synthetase